MQKLSILILISVICLSAYSQKQINFSSLTLDSLKKETNARNMLIYIFFTNPNCGPCKKMQKEVFTDSAVADYYNGHFINTIVNNTRNDLIAQNLCANYNIIRYPSHFYINTQGQVVNSTTGYQNALEFIKLGESTIQGLTRDYYYNKVKAGDYSFETVSKSLDLEDTELMFSDSGYKCRSGEILENYFNHQEERDYTSNDNWFLIKKYVFNPHSLIFQYLVSHQDEFVKLYGMQAVDLKIYDVYNWYVTGASSAELSKEVRTMNIPQAKVWVKFHDIMDDLYRIRKDKSGDWNDLVRSANEFILENYYMINQIEVNSWCWDIYSRYKKRENISIETLKIINEWMKKITELNHDYEYEDTYAHILFALGNQELAVKTENSAITHALENKAGKDEIDTFMKELEVFKKKSTD